MQRTFTLRVLRTRNKENRMPTSSPLPSTALFAALLLLALPATAAFPGSPNRPFAPGEEKAHPAKRHLERLADFLDLDAAQRTRAAAILDAARDRVEPLREEGAQAHRRLRDAVASRDRHAIADAVLSLDAMRDELREVRTEVADQLATVLTAEQAARFAVLREWLEERGRQPLRQR
jgi:Spy/CpxP family protein refolding chaperone